MGILLGFMATSYYAYTYYLENEMFMKGYNQFKDNEF